MAEASQAEVALAASSHGCCGPKCPTVVMGPFFCSHGSGDTSPPHPQVLVPSGTQRPANPCPAFAEEPGAQVPSPSERLQAGYLLPQTQYARLYSGRDHCDICVSGCAGLNECLGQRLAPRCPRWHLGWRGGPVESPKTLLSASPSGPPNRHLSPALRVTCPSPGAVRLAGGAMS